MPSASLEKATSHGRSCSLLSYTCVVFNSCRAAATSFTLPSRAWQKKTHSQIRPEWRGWYSTKGPHLFAPVTLPPTPAEPYEPEFGWWAVSTDSAASSAALSSRGDTANASPFLHKCDGSAQRHKSDERKPNGGWIMTSKKVMKSYVFIAEFVLKNVFSCSCCCKVI